MEFKELIFVSGKGGTGKTTFAMHLASRLSTQNKRVLLVELAETSSVASLANLDLAPGYQPVATRLGYDLCCLTGLGCLVEYVGAMTGTGKLAGKVFEASIIRTLVNVAPGLNDLSVLGKLTSQIRKHGPGFDYDHVIVDAHSTGSFDSLLKAPELLAKSVKAGPLKRQSEAIIEVLRDSKSTQYFLMGLFEELALDELLESLASLKQQLGKQVSVVMNKKLPAVTIEANTPTFKKFYEDRIRLEESCRERLQGISNSYYELQVLLGAYSEGSLCLR